MNLASLSIKRPSFMITMFVIMLIVGLISMSRLGIDQFPDITSPMVSVITMYSGAGPQEIETLVSKPLEDELSSLAGIKHLSSTNQDGLSIVTVEFVLGTDIKYAEQKVRDKVFAARSKLPLEAEESTLRRYDPSDMPVLQLALSAELPPAKLYDLAKNEIKTRLEQIPNVALVTISGGTKREIQVNLDRTELKNHELSLTAISQKLNSQNMPVGKYSSGSHEILFRALGEYRALDQIRQTAINFMGSDRPVSVSDIGTVTDTVETPKTYAYLNGIPSMFVNVYRQSGSNTVEVVDTLLKKMDNINAGFKSLPGQPQLKLIRDNAEITRINIADVRDAIVEGILLTLIVVYFFLGSGRSTFITIVALPNSLIGAFILMYFMGFTINVITLMALSLSVGLLVDDAIVVRENIWRHLELGKTPKQAAIEGTNEVALAVVATTAAVMAVFLPVGFIQGTVGQFFKQLGWTVVFAMAISLVDSMTMAPLLSCYLAGKSKDKNVAKMGIFNTLLWPLHWLVKKFDNFQDWLSEWYERIIRVCLKHRVLVFTVSFLVFFSSLALLPRIQKTFMPTQDMGFLQITMTAQPGTSLEGMRGSALEVLGVLQKHKEISLTALQVGNDDGENNVASIYLEMVDHKHRSITTAEFKQKLREELKAFSSINPVVGDMSMGGQSSPFSMNLISSNLDSLAQASVQVKQALANVPGLVDLDSSYRPGKPEYQVKMDPRRMQQLGVSSASIGMELRGLVEGLLPAKFREADNEYDIRVRLKENQRDLRQGMEKYYVPNMNGRLIRLSDVCEAKSTSGPLKITRRDRQRYISVSGQLGPKGALGNVQEQAERIISSLKLPPDLHYEFAGQAEDLSELFTSIGLVFVLAIVFIYLILTTLYESTIMPLLIMLALPMAVVGALAALYLTNQSLNMFSLIAFIMLLGLVVKNSILLVDYTIRLIRSGMPRREAIIQAGKVRLRPILMTTLALIAGMLPLALALTEAGRFRQSMGIAVIGGLLTSTFLTLLVIPSGFEWADEIRQWFRRLFGRPPLREIDLAEAKPESVLTEAQRLIKDSGNGKRKKQRNVPAKEPAGNG